MRNKFVVIVCCLSLLLMFPACHRNQPISAESSDLSSEYTDTATTDTENTSNSVLTGDTNVTTLPATPQTSATIPDVNETTTASELPSQTVTTQTAPADPAAGTIFNVSNFALGGKMAFTDTWVYFIDNTAPNGGVRFSSDFSHVEGFRPDSIKATPFMEINDDRVFYEAAVSSGNRLYSCDLSGNDKKDLGIEMLSGDIGFYIQRGSVYYVNPQSALMKADLTAGNQQIVMNLAPLTCSLSTSRMAVTEDSLFLMLTNDNRREVETYRISLKDNTNQLIHTMTFQSDVDYQQFCANGQILIPYNGWLYFHGYNNILKMSGDGVTVSTIHVGDRMIDSMLIQNGKLYYMEDGCMYAISLDNETVKSVGYISLPFQHNGMLDHDYTNVKFLGCDDMYIYTMRIEPLNVVEGSEITDSRTVIERVPYDGSNPQALFTSK